MSLDFSGLGDLARANPAKVAKGWSPLTLDDLGYGTAMCFDQSLTATGCVMIHRSHAGLQVYSAAKWADNYDGQDVPTSLKRGVAVFNQARQAIRYGKIARVDAFVHESPPNPKAVKGGGTSSLMAAQALHCAAEVEGVEIEMLGAQPGKKLVCGNANAAKTEAHAALRRDVLPWIEDAGQVSNEATRDALMVGLLWLARRK